VFTLERKTYKIAGQALAGVKSTVPYSTEA